MKITPLLFIFILASCGGVSKNKLSSEAKEMRVLTQKKGHNCNVVGKVTGINKDDSVELARNHARNLAVKEGADAIYFDEEVSNGGKWKVMATAYQCQ